MDIDMLAVHCDRLQLFDGFSETDAELRARVAFPVHAGTGAAGCAIVYFELAPGDHVGWHSHNAEEIVCVLDGEAEAHVEHERARLTRGGLALVPSFARHNVVNVGADTVRVIGFFSASAVAVQYEHAVAPMGARDFVIGGADTPATAERAV
jgi:quercetin dioxygenase-like cupin family protein